MDKYEGQGAPFDEPLEPVKKEVKHLCYSMMTAGMGCHEDRHPQMVMKELGITYLHATPQSIADQWLFWCCENIPAKLPEYLREFKADPMEYIGYGLSPEVAGEIRDYKQSEGDITVYPLESDKPTLSDTITYTGGSVTLCDDEEGKP